MRLPVTSLLLALGGCLVARAAEGSSTEVIIDVDATAPGEELRHVWSYYGYDEVNYTTTPDGEELLRLLAQASRVPPRIRTHFLFNTGDGTPSLKWGSTNLYTEDDDGSPVYDYTIIDQIMDAKLHAGTLPLVELAFMPQALSTAPEPYQNSSPYTLDGGSFYPPTDYDKWADLVTAWAEHVKERYPESAEDWQWELWNEPDIGYWRGTFEEYARLFDTTEAALHAVFPEASLGGPAVANVRNTFLAEFLEHCASGTNAVSGEVGTRLDMVSFHAKGGVALIDDYVRMDLGTQLRLHQLGFDTIAASSFSNVPVVLSEADPDGCAGCPVETAPHFAYRNSPAYGAYEVAMMKHTLDLASAAGLDLHGVLTWAFTFPDTPYFAGYRALTTNGIHLPVLNAFKLLGELAGDRLPVESTGARTPEQIIEQSVRDQPELDALATLEQGRIQVLVYNYHDDLAPAEATPVRLRIRVPSELGRRVALTHTRVDKEHGDAYSVWVEQEWPREPTAAQRAELEQAMLPGVLEDKAPMDVEDGVVALSFDLPRHGLSLLTLERLDPDQDEPPRDDPGCACRLETKAGHSASIVLGALLVAASAFRRRRRPIRH